MNDVKLLLVDTDDYSASLLVDELARHGFQHVRRIARTLDIPGTVSRERPDLVLFNHHFDRPDDLLGCCTIRLAAPDTAVIAIAAAGPSARQVRDWAADNGGAVDAVLQKPLATGELVGTARDLLRARQSRRQLEVRNERLTSLLPEGALAALRAGHGQEELFEAAVLFTDVRKSSDVITRMPPRDFFRLLNRSLSAQAAVVRRFEGQVVKYTGDGLMAVFRGMGRTYLGVRCAVELAGGGASTRDLQYGVGVAEGLVLAGVVGSDGADSQRQYDVIGATVHLAARLCGLAAPGEAMMTAAAHAASRLQGYDPRSVPQVAVRGFPQPVDCVALLPLC